MKLWPQPNCADVTARPDPATLPELEASHLLEGPLVTFRVTQAMLNTGVMEMPPGHVVKVPEHLSEEPAIRVQVQVAPGSTHTIIFTALHRGDTQQAAVGATPSGTAPADVPAPVDAPGDVPAVSILPPPASTPSQAAVPSPAAIPPPSAMASPMLQSPGSMASPGSMPPPVGLPPHGGGSPFVPMKSPLFPMDSSSVTAMHVPSELRAWHISGLAEVLQTVGCSVADELCIEKCVLLFR